MAGTEGHAGFFLVSPVEQQRHHEGTGGDCAMEEKDLDM